MGQLVDYKGRMLNHVEMLYQPGERSLAVKVYEALGCRVSQTDGETMVVHVAPDQNDPVNNVLYSSEVSPEQWQLEQELRAARTDRPSLAAAFATYDHKLRNHPHGITHFGIRYPSFARLEEALARMGRDLDPRLEGRLSVSAVFRPHDAGARSDRLIQAFVTTDVVAAGLFMLGQLIELQAQELE